MLLRVVADRPFQDFANRLRFAWRVRQWVRQLRAARPSRLAIVALEPFTGGPLGLYAAWRAHGALICEVNGVYSSYHNIANSRTAVVRSMRILARRLLGVFVLRRAAAVHHLVVSPSPLRAGQVAILAGDFLLARASVTLASLRNPEVIMLISQVRAGAGARALSPGG